MYTRIENAKITPKSDPNAVEITDSKPTKPETPLFQKVCGQFETAQYQEIWDNSPQSTEYNIVFPWHKQCKEYSVINFHPTQVGHRISYNDIKHVTTSLKSLKLYDSESLIRRQIFFRNLWTILPFITTVIIILFFAEHITVHLKANINLAFFMIPLLVFEIGWIFFITKAMAKRFNKIMIKREKEITKILDKWNENMFEPRGLKLVSGVYGAWIEMEVGYMGEGEFMPIGKQQENLEGKMKYFERRGLEKIMEREDESEE